MTKQQFLSLGEALSTRAGVMDSLHGYFRSAASRLYSSLNRFELFSKPLGDVLEVGPFYGYVPFALKPRATSYTVLEGDDPAAHGLLPLYKEESIACSFVDLFEMFGPVSTASHALDFPDNSFDTILCWETMEHFNFNPVKFVRELHRVLRPNGRVCITVPNRASFQGLVSLIFGRGEERQIQNFYQFEDYESNGKKAFYGFHWREYAPKELALLFKSAGFKLERSGSFTVFQDNPGIGVIRKLARVLSSIGTMLLPRYGTNVYLIASK